MDISAITQHKAAVDSYLVSFLRSKQKASAHSYEVDFIERLIPFATSGKTIRGCLVIFAHSLFTQEGREVALPVAAAAELFQSGFLIHDDIMDADEVRRGKPAIHMQYASAVAPKSMTHGINMGINGGDYCFFLGYQLLTSGPGSSFAVAHIFSQEFPHVVAAQMADVSGPVAAARLTQDEILDIYKYKTARYTFSLPLCVGAVMAHANTEVVHTLEVLGENLGLLFQIRDDELNAFAQTQTSGKSVGSDRITGKQTLMLHHLQLEYPDKKFATMSDTDFIQLYKKSESAKKILQIKQELSKAVAESIHTLPIGETGKLSLLALAEFVQTREN